MKPDDRWYVWVPTAGLDAFRALGGVVGSQADDGRWLGKIRADKQSDIRPLPQGSTVIQRTDNERNERKLDSVYIEVEAKTVNVRAAQVDV